MSKYEIKTKAGDTDPKKVINAVENDTRREDALVLLKLMEKITKEKAVVWGNGIIGFGSYDYESKSGCVGSWPLTGFSPRKSNLVIYIMPGFSHWPDLMKKLGKCKNGSSCLYLNKLADVDVKVLEKLIAEAYKHMKTKYKHC